MKQPTGRVSAFVDGFNVYYSIRSNPHFQGLKWVNYRKLCSLVLPQRLKLGDVFYFTAFYYDDPPGVTRHQDYIKALRSVDVVPKYGKFKQRDRKCGAKCKQWFTHPEEKQTDVNIAVQLFVEAINDTFDTALLVTGDTDLLPVIDALHVQFPGKVIGVFQPPGRRAKELREAVDFFRRMKKQHLESAQFPETLDLRDGSKLVRPAKWAPAKGRKRG